MFSMLTLLLVLLSPINLVYTQGDCTCGVSKSSGLDICDPTFNLKVIGGREAEINEFPWTALLEIRAGEAARNIEPIQRCGGTLINDRFVITAAHCIPDSSDPDIIVILGEHDTTTSRESASLRIPVKPFGINKHWGFKEKRGKDDKEQGVWYDFALIELAVSVDFKRNPHIQPVCLPANQEVDYEDKTATVIGWGHQKITYLSPTQQGVVKGISSRNSKQLQKLDVRLVRKEECEDIYHTVSPNLRLKESNLCAVSPFGDSCKGDSGGGLVRANCNGRFYELVGIVSVGVGCNSTINGVKIPAVYGRVSTVVDWISHQTSNGDICDQPTNRETKAVRIPPVSSTTEFTGSKSGCGNHADKRYEYRGGCKKSQYHGIGNLSYPDGGSYSGEWINGLRNGNGKMEFSLDNDEGRKTYIGEWRNDVIEGLGKLTWRHDNPYDVVMYVGYFLNDKEHGYGRVMWQGGYIYIGDWVHGKNTGNGKYTWPNGDSYSGNFVKGLLNGKGTKVWMSGDVYSGDWVNGTRTGQGNYTWGNGKVKGDSYSGDFINDVITGSGSYHYANGNRYEGQFTNNNFDGKGTYIWKSGDVYTGDWVESARTGKGKLVWKNGNVYTGDFVNGVRTGRGTFTFENGKWKGDVYRGEFINDSMTGSGIYQYANGKRYEGQLINNEFNGEGRLVWKNADVYIGDFKNSVRTGKGTYFWANGDVYRGEFVNDTKTGKGTYVWANGDVCTANWINDKQIGSCN